MLRATWRDSDPCTAVAMQWKQVAGIMLEARQTVDALNVMADDMVDLGFRMERIGKMSSSC